MTSKIIDLQLLKAQLYQHVLIETYFTQFCLASGKLWTTMLVTRTKSITEH